jgi:hypothetical protein
MIRLRQIAFAAHDLDSAEEALSAALRVRLCDRHPNIGVFGLRNALYPVGDQFLEIVSPVVPGTAAGRLLGKRASTSTPRTSPGRSCRSTPRTIPPSGRGPDRAGVTMSTRRPSKRSSGWT